MIRDIIRFFIKRIKGTVVQRESHANPLISCKVKSCNTIRRINLIVSQLDNYHRDSRKKVLRANSSTDIYRFILRLCEADAIKYRNAGGYAKCNISLPKKVGRMTLIENRRNKNKRDIAVLKLNIPKLNPKIEEIIIRTQTGLN